VTRGKNFAIKLMCSRKQELEMHENKTKAEKERQEAVERHARLHCQQQDDERHQKILSKLEEIQKREIKENLKVIFCTFNFWQLLYYGISIQFSLFLIVCLLFY